MSTTTSSGPRAATPARTAPEPGTRPWRLAGGFALAHVVLLVLGIALQDSPLFQDGTAGIQRGYVEGDVAGTITGGMIEGFGFVLLLPALVFLSRAVGRRTEAGRWATQTALAAGLGYVAVTMAVGLPAGAAALYGARHGLDVETAFAVNNIRIFGYFLSLFLLGAHAVGLALAARQDGVKSRWLGWGGLVTGGVLFLSVPAATIGQQDWGTLVWLIWWLGIAVFLFRHQPADHQIDEATS